MTKSSEEVEMTAKDKVLAYYGGNADVTGPNPDGTNVISTHIGDGVHHIIGKGVGVEAAWKNAAESLPAQGGQDDPYACSFTASGEHSPSPVGDCLYCGSKGRTHSLRPESLPVEDKEKEINESYHWCRYCGRITNHNPKSRFCLNCDGLDEFSDPMPTPSTPAAVEAFCPKCKISITNTTAGVHECPACHGPVEQPQPDSSSIPCVGCEGRPVAPNDPCALCGSSTEQTYAESTKALHASIIDQGRKVLNATSEIGMSHAEYIEWAIERLEGK